MKIEITAFTEQGQDLADRLAAELEGSSVRSDRTCPLREWVRDAFANADALIYVGAVGICVRTIAPCIKNKWTDPAVVVIDETARYVIPVLSGHLGGANDLARRIAAVTGAEPVITTATDRRNVFSVDSWARFQGCAVENPEEIRRVSMKLLEGDVIRIRSDYPIAGDVPERVEVETGRHEEQDFVRMDVSREQADVCLSIYRTADRKKEKGLLRIVPRIACAGVGCKRGIPEEKIKEAVGNAFAEAGISEYALSGVFSIDLKKDEEGLNAFCRNRKVPFVTFPAEELKKVKGEFSSSAFVTEITGVDNVCERSAVLGTGMINGRIVFSKHVYNGVTVALALADFKPDFQWRQE